MVELVFTRDLKSLAFGHVGSSPTSGTKFLMKGFKMNKYHAHFTLANNCELIVPKGFKRTEIFLQDQSQVQHDVMLTKYYGGKSFSGQGQMVEEVLQDAKRFGNLLRVKLEYQGDDVHEAFTLHHENYVEAHVKVQTDSPEELFEFAKTIDGCVLVIQSLKVCIL